MTAEIRWGGLILLAVGGGLVARGVWHLTLGRKSTGWSKTRGRIVSAEAEDYDEKDDRLFLVYEYTVDGVLYRGDRIQFAGPPTIGRNNDGLSRWLVTLFGDTAHVDVYYDPARPWDAVLIAGITGTAVWELLLGILITAAVLFRW